jgi:hypothetical protein
MSDKATHELIDEAARRIAKDIIEGEMTPNERVKAFETLIDYRKVVQAPAQPEKPPQERFDQMRDKIRAAGAVGAVKLADVVNNHTGVSNESTE